MSDEQDIVASVIDNQNDGQVDLMGVGQDEGKY